MWRRNFLSEQSAKNQAASSSTNLSSRQITGYESCLSFSFAPLLLRARQEGCFPVSDLDGRCCVCGSSRRRWRSAWTLDALPSRPDTSCRSGSHRAPRRPRSPSPAQFSPCSQKLKNRSFYDGVRVGGITNKHSFVSHLRKYERCAGAGRRTWFEFPAGCGPNPPPFRSWTSWSSLSPPNKQDNKREWVSELSSIPTFSWYSNQNDFFFVRHILFFISPPAQFLCWSRAGLSRRCLAPASDKSRTCNRRKKKITQDPTTSNWFLRLHWHFFFSYNKKVILPKKGK